MGLNEKEAKVYTSLLQLGRGSAYAVAERAELKRPTTYVILGELMQKGLVLKIPRTKKQLFAAKPPDEFFAETEERLRVARNVLPQLMAMAEKPEQKFRTLYFEGKKGVRDMVKLLYQKMEGKEVTGFYAKALPEQEELNEFFREQTNERKRLGITIRGVTSNDPSLDWYKKHLEEFGYKIKFLDKNDYSSDCSIEIGDDFVQIVSVRYLQGIHIENPDIANAMRQIFEMVWSARPEKVEGVVE